jgi:hypothetical protein
MSEFKDRLWRELVREHGADLAQIDRPAAGPGRRAPPRVLAGAGLGLAGVAAALVIALTPAGSSPAYAVTRNHDGTVTITVRTWSALSRVNGKLSALGIPVQAVPVAASCAKAAYSTGVPQAMRLARAVAANGTQLKLDPRKIPAGRLEVLAAYRDGGVVHLVPAHSVPGSAAPRCLWAAPAVPLVGGAARCSTQGLRLPAAAQRARADVLELIRKQRAAKPGVGMSPTTGQGNTAIKLLRVCYWTQRVRPATSAHRSG